MSINAAFLWTLDYVGDGSSTTLVVNVLSAPFYHQNSNAPLFADGRLGLPTAVAPPAGVTATIDGLGNVIFTFTTAPTAAAHTMSGSFLF